MCVEWLKVNRPEAGDRRPEGGKEFRLEVQEMPKPTPQPEHPQVNPVPIPDLPPPAYCLQPDQIASFKALGVSVCLESEHIGQIWIVPEYTVPSVLKGPWLDDLTDRLKESVDEARAGRTFGHLRSLQEGRGLRRTDLIDVSFDYRKMALKYREAE